VSDVDAAATQREYLQHLKAEITDLGNYSKRQLRRHRLLRMIVITTGIAVPVLSAWSAVPREVIALVGALTAVAEGTTQLFGYQTTGTQAMTTANQLERELNRFLLSAGPYAAGQNFGAFVDRIEQIREAADNAFVQTWQKPVDSRGAPGVEGGGGARRFRRRASPGFPFWRPTSISARRRPPESSPRTTSAARDAELPSPSRSTILAD
jgi:hypothetical protein